MLFHRFVQPQKVYVNTVKFPTKLLSFSYFLYSTPFISTTEYGWGGCFIGVTSNLMGWGFQCETFLIGQVFPVLDFCRFASVISRFTARIALETCQL